MKHTITIIIAIAMAIPITITITIAIAIAIAIVTTTSWIEMWWFSKSMFSAFAKSLQLAWALPPGALEMLFLFHWMRSGAIWFTNLPFVQTLALVFVCCVYTYHLSVRRYTSSSGDVKALGSEACARPWSHVWNSWVLSPH
jgi:hypothetical protein